MVPKLNKSALDSSRLGFWRYLDLRDDLFFILHGALVGECRKTQKTGLQMVCFTIAIEHRLESGILLRPKYRYGSFGNRWFIAERTSHHHKVQPPTKRMDASHFTVPDLALHCNKLECLYFALQLKTNILQELVFGSFVFKLTAEVGRNRAAIDILHPS